MGMGCFFYPPRVETIVDSIAPDLRLFHESGVISVFCEAEFSHKNPQNFIDLQYYVGYQLLFDVELDEEALINDYMDNVYGPAAPLMKKFLEMLRESVRNEPVPLFYGNKARTYTDGAFLEEVYQLLNRARDAVHPESEYYRLVQQEMIAPLGVILLNPQYDFFDRTGISREDILEEYRAARLNRIEQPWVSEQRRADDLAALEQD